MTTSVELTNDRMVYRRGEHACTEFDMAALQSAEVLTVRERCYWHLRGAGKLEAIVPVGIPGENLIRHYLSEWRGFDYDGLVRFVSEPPANDRRRLWPAG